MEGTTDPFRTLFVARISLDVTERKLVKEYSRFGTITKCVMIMDNESEPRGYAFLEFEKESDMREAYKKGDGLKINGRRVLVDVERGRTVRGWLPRRLGNFALHLIAYAQISQIWSQSRRRRPWWHTHRGQA